MARERISTTVDTDRLAAARSLFGVPDSELMDRALAALLAEVAARHERRRLVELPYDEDELSWLAPVGEPLPYDGEVPAEVEALARERRGSYRTT